MQPYDSMLNFVCWKVSWQGRYKIGNIFQLWLCV